MKVKSFPSFNSLEEIVERFQKLSSKIIFENYEYKYVNIVFKGQVNKLVYRCEEEQHNLIISMIGDVVIDVAGVYSVGDVAM